MFEIDVDVRRFAAFLGNEAGEEQVMFHRVGRGDAEQITDRAVRRGPAPLTEDFLILSKFDNIVDGQKIGRIFHLFDQPQFLLDLDAQPFRKGLAMPLMSGGPCQMREPALRCPAFGYRFFGIMIAQLVEREIDQAEQLLRLGQRLRMVAEQARHFRRRFEKTLGIGGKQAARFGNRGLLGNAGEDVVEGALFRRRIERIVGGDERDAVRFGKAVQSGEMALVRSGARHGGAQPDMGGMGEEVPKYFLPARSGGRGGGGGRPPLNVAIPSPAPPPSAAASLWLTVPLPEADASGRMISAQSSLHHSSKSASYKKQSPFSARKLPVESSRVSRPQPRRLRG